MDISMLFSDSFNYSKEAVAGKWMKWVLLIVSTIIFPLIIGYEMMIMRGEKPAPELGNWGKLFIDGLLLFIVGFIYSILIMIIYTVFGFLGFIGLIIAMIASIVIYLFAVIGYVRFARTGKFGEAFNFNEIIGKIKSIGWVNYIIQLLVLFIVLGVVLGIIFAILSVIAIFIPVVGSLLMLIISLALMPVIAIFSARYICLIYDSA